MPPTGPADPPAAAPAVVRRSAFDDLDPRTAYLLWALRESVFVVEQRCCYQELDGRDLEPGTRHLWVEVDGQPVAYLRVLHDLEVPGGRRIGRVLAAGSRRGRGLATLLMRAALEETGDAPVRLDAQSHLAGWYETLGFTRSGADFVEDGIPHTPMKRDGAPSR